MDHRAVVDPALDEIQEIASGDGCSVSIEFEGDRAFAGGELNGGLALQTGAAGLSATGRNRCGGL